MFYRIERPVSRPSAMEMIPRALDLTFPAHCPQRSRSSAAQAHRIFCLRPLHWQPPTLLTIEGSESFERPEYSYGLAYSGIVDDLRQKYNLQSRIHTTHRQDRVALARRPMTLKISSLNGQVDHVPACAQTERSIVLLSGTKGAMS